MLYQGSQGVKLSAVSGQLSAKTKIVRIALEPV
jgi:hypothetical protein